ncbi:hypothetical protein LIER_22051 [Lithospermum erythrorhizon]|uniref:Uncharacterized protein n=1 Tax=Lithospermum erythrorhizon TaxID=34254 RepID=A0AAV3QTZ4_LITER
MALDDYYNKLIGLFDELARLKPPGNCTCGKCTCGVVTHYEKDREEERLHQFFVGIDDDLYGVVRSNLLSREPMPTLDEAYNVFVQDENSKTIAIRRKNRTRFMLLLFPRIQEERRQGKSGAVHPAAVAPGAVGRGRGSTPQVNVVAVPEHVGLPVEQTRGDSLVDLKPDQVRVLMNMIRNQQTDSLTGE